MGTPKTFRIGIDVDGVLANFCGGMVKLLKSLGDTTNLPIENPTFPAVWYWNKHYGVPEDLWAQAWDTITTEENFWVSLRDLPTTPQDIVALKQVFNHGHEIYFLTTRPGMRAKFQTEAWLAVRQILCPTVLIADSPEAKGLIARGLKLDAMIDDRPENLMAMPESVQRFLYMAPYNREWHTQFPGLAWGVESVTEMLDVLDKTGTVDLQKAA